MEIQVRFCVCGFSAAGTRHERNMILNQHRLSGEHDQRERDNQVANADAACWAILESEVSEA